MDLDEVYSDLVKKLGEHNLKFEYFNGDDNETDELNLVEILKRLYSKVKLTYLPSDTVFLGTKSDTQLENAINAMTDLKTYLGEQ